MTAPTHFAAKAALLAAVDRLFDLDRRADRGEFALKGSVTSAYTDDNEMVAAAFASVRAALDDVAHAITGEPSSDLDDAEDDIVRRFWANADEEEAANAAPEEPDALTVAIMRRCGALV